MIEPPGVRSGSVKVFGCRPLTNDCHTHERPAFENLQGRKPREMGCGGAARAMGI